MTLWNSEKDEILIKFVRSHEALYNIKCKEHRKTEMKQRLWSEVAAVLGITETECTKRWGYIRDYYIRSKRKVSSSGEQAKKRSELLSFLDNVSSLANNPGNIGEGSISYSFIMPQKDEDTRESDYSDHNQETDEVAYDYKEEANQNSNHSNDANSYSKYESRKRKQSSYQECNPQIASIASLNELDETDLFFSSMAKIVKKLPRQDQAQLRMQIGMLVGNAELSYISNVYNTQPSTSDFT